MLIIQIIRRQLVAAKTERMLVGISTFAFFLFAARPVVGSPNFIIFFADDVGYGDFQSFGHPAQEKGPIDVMGDEGMRFTSWYSGDALCSPSRASLLTGSRVGVRLLVLPGDLICVCYKSIKGDCQYGWVLLDQTECFGSGIREVYPNPRLQSLKLYSSKDMLQEWLENGTLVGHDICTILECFSFLFCFSIHSPCFITFFI